MMALPLHMVSLMLLHLEPYYLVLQNGGHSCITAENNVHAQKRIVDIPTAV